jgi:hypothetical protein
VDAEALRDRMMSGETTRIAEYRSIRQPTTSSSRLSSSRKTYFE